MTNIEIAKILKDKSDALLKFSETDPNETEEMLQAYRQSVDIGNWGDRLAALPEMLEKGDRRCMTKQ